VVTRPIDHFCESGSVGDKKCGGRGPRMLTNEKVEDVRKQLLC
jgi:hypothetical protein